MRIFAVPAALLLSCCLYMPLPRARKCFCGLLSRGYICILRAFTRKNGQSDDIPALIVYLLLLSGVLALLGAVHPLTSMVLMMPVFTGFCVLPACAEMKLTLDSGKYAKDIPAYEALVRQSCASLAPAFSEEIVAPMLLGALGMPLYLGAALCWIYAALTALAGRIPAAARIVSLVHRFSIRVFTAFLLLCSGVVGRNPLHVSGHTLPGRLLSILGIAGDASDTHAPVAGDIAQGIFLCAFASAVLCFALCAVGFVLCR
ncbi:MAG: hypothetical protein IKJ11_07330 [Clostridia bacterium]|nr:hypothetical protein [Clostridia bacterium]